MATVVYTTPRPAQRSRHHTSSRRAIVAQRGLSPRSPHIHQTNSDTSVYASHLPRKQLQSDACQAFVRFRFRPAVCDVKLPNKPRDSPITSARAHTHPVRSLLVTERRGPAGRLPPPSPPRPLRWRAGAACDWSRRAAADGGGGGGEGRGVRWRSLGEG